MKKRFEVEDIQGKHGLNPVPNYHIFYFIGVYGQLSVNNEKHGDLECNRKWLSEEMDCGIVLLDLLY